MCLAKQRGCWVFRFLLCDFWVWNFFYGSGALSGFCQPKCIKNFVSLFVSLAAQHLQIIYGLRAGGLLRRFRLIRVPPPNGQTQPKNGKCKLWDKSGGVWGCSHNMPTLTSACLCRELIKKWEFLGVYVSMDFHVALHCCYFAHLLCFWICHVLFLICTGSWQIPV